MMEPVKRSGLEATGLGIAAGAVFAGAGVMEAAVRGVNPFYPFHLFASLVLGQEVVSSGGLSVVLFGALVNVVFSGAFGFLYGALCGFFSTKTRTELPRQLALGLGYGTLLYLLDFQLIGRALLPWVLDAPQPAYLALHALFYGVPVAVGYTLAERRRLEGSRKPDAPDASSTPSLPHAGAPH